MLGACLPLSPDPSNGPTMRDHHRSSLARHPALTAAAIAFALLASTVAAATDQNNPAASGANPAPPPTNVVYKWKDAHGISQYSQQPPPKGVKYEMIENSGAASPASTGSDNPAAAPDGAGQN